MTDNAAAAQRLRAAISNRGIIATGDLLAVLDEHAALLAAEPRPAMILTSDAVMSRDDYETLRGHIRSGRFRLHRRTLSGRLDHIADSLFRAASRLETTRPDAYQPLIDNIIALRVEAEQARAAETKLAGR